MDKKDTITITFYHAHRFKSRYCKRLLHLRVLRNRVRHLHRLPSQCARRQSFRLHRHLHLRLTHRLAMHRAVVHRLHRTHLTPHPVRYPLPVHRRRFLAVLRQARYQRQIHPATPQQCRPWRLRGNTIRRPPIRPLLSPPTATDCQPLHHLLLPTHRRWQMVVTAE